MSFPKKKIFFDSKIRTEKGFYDKDSFICNVQYDLTCNRVLIKNSPSSLKVHCLAKISIALWKNKFIYKNYEFEMLKKPLPYDENSKDFRIPLDYYNNNFFLPEIKNLEITAILSEEILYMCKHIYHQFYLLKDHIFKHHPSYCLEHLFKNLQWTLDGLLLINFKKTFERMREIKETQKNMGIREKRNIRYLLYLIDMDKEKLEKFQRNNENLLYFKFDICRFNNSMIHQHFFEQFLNDKERNEILNNINLWWKFYDPSVIYYILPKLKYKHIFSNKNLAQRILIVEILDNLCSIPYQRTFVFEMFDRVKEFLFINLNLWDAVNIIMEFVNRSKITEKLLVYIWQLFEYKYNDEVESNQKQISEIMFSKFRPSFTNVEFFKLSVFSHRKWRYHFQKLMFSENFGVQICKKFLAHTGGLYDIFIKSLFDGDGPPAEFCMSDNKILTEFSNDIVKDVEEDIHNMCTSYITILNNIIDYE